MENNKSNPASKKPKAVICKLSSKAHRDNLLGAIQIYNRKNPKNKLNTKLIGYGDTESPVYVSEHLTPANKSLHAATRIAAKEKNYKYVWVRNGKIFIRKDETATSQIITHHSVQENLLKNPKYFWSYIKHKRDNKSTIPKKMTLNNAVATDGDSIANLFAENFASVKQQLRSFRYEQFLM
ncbi:hypothetical protein HW555_011163 [Spodoptera exigua]|uniref:FP protein C-terminal domain-containing protein n=1 Tax=Spodoptera exigua TaxID=7107 RepID=A0A835G863_SPOEX|nr:hypothetical protein HW555_011163 [Spodoptera exigua]